VDALDEVALRRPDFQGGEPIEMADGQAWTIPKPLLEFVPKFADDGTITAGIATSLGPVFDRLMEDYDRACQAAQVEAGEVPDGPRPLDLLMRLAAYMLRLNYNLEPASLGVLLRWRPDDEATADRWGSIMNVARGIAPKPRAGGSA
jgi:hypothetical protein